MARAALAAAPPGTAAFADPGDLRCRIRRLQQPPAGGTRRSLALALTGVLLTAALALAACQALRAGVTWPGPGRLAWPCSATQAGGPPGRAADG